MSGLAPGIPLRHDVEAYRADFCIPAVGGGTSVGALISRRKSGVEGTMTLEGQLYTSSYIPLAGEE